MTGFAIAALLALSGAPVAPPVFRTQIGLVILQATVKNARGEAVPGLDRDAFTVYENGRPQAVTLFRRDDVPVSLGLAIDGSRSIRDMREEIAVAARTLVRASNPEDEVFLIRFDEKPRMEVPFTSDLAVLEDGLRQLDAVGGTALRDAIEEGERYLSAQAARDRRCLLVITDGTDNASTTTVAKIREAARKQGILIYAIGLRGGTDAPREARARHDLEEITEATGGVAYFPRTPDEAGAVALLLARQIRSQYIIGYNPSNQALDGSYRKLRVVARGAEKLTVRTRAGYRATPDGAARGTLLRLASPEYVDEAESRKK